MLNQPFSFKNQTLSHFIACFCITHYGLPSVNVLILLFLIFVTSASHLTPVLKGPIEIQFSNISIPAESKLFSTTWRNVGYTFFAPLTFALSLLCKERSHYRHQSFLVFQKKPKHWKYEYKMYNFIKISKYFSRCT